VDFNFTAEENAFRKEVRAFLEAELPPTRRSTTSSTRTRAVEVRLRVHPQGGEKGWIGLTWPKEYGAWPRPLPPADHGRGVRLHEPAGQRDRMGLARGLLVGHEEQKRRFLPASPLRPVLAEGLTEPDSGSDLASLSTGRARR